MLKLVEEDKLLKPFAGIIEKRHQQVLAMEREFTYRTTRLSDSCNSYLYYGLHRTNGCFENGRRMPRQSIC